MLNEKLVKEIPHKSKEAEALFTLWAMRQRNARGGRSTIIETQRQLHKEGYAVATEQLKPIFRDLQKAGAGVLQGNTFIWHRHTGLRELAKEALAEGVKEVYKPEPTSGLLAYKVVVAYLGGDRKAKVEVPADLTPKESIFISGLLNGHA